MSIKTRKTSKTRKTNKARTDQRLWGSVRRSAAMVVSAVGLLSLLGLGAAAMAQASSAPPPDMEVLIDEAYLVVEWPDMDRVNADEFLFELEEIGGEGLQRAGSFDRSFITFNLPEGRTFKLRTAGRYGSDQSEWTAWVDVAANDTTVSPWSVAASAGDGKVHLSWDATGTSLYRYHIWSGAGDHRYVWVDGTSATITGLTNGTTYKVSLMSQIGSTFTDWTDPIAITPTAGVDVGLVPRSGLDFRFVDSNVFSFATWVDDPAGVADLVNVRSVSSSGMVLRAGSTPDPQTPPRAGADLTYWSGPMALDEFDQQVITEVFDDGDAIVASSVQLFIGWSDYDIDLVGTDPTQGPSRAGSFR